MFDVQFKIKHEEKIHVDSLSIRTFVLYVSFLYVFSCFDNYIFIGSTFAYYLLTFSHRNQIC